MNAGISRFWYRGSRTSLPLTASDVAASPAVPASGTFVRPGRRSRRARDEDSYSDARLVRTLDRGGLVSLVGFPDKSPTLRTIPAPHIYPALQHRAFLGS